MTLFLLTSAVLFLSITAYFYLLAKSRKSGFRFQTRLTIIMLLLTLTPAVPLMLFSSALLNRSLDILVAGYLEDTLDSSIAALRNQLIERNAEAFDRLQEVNTLDELLEWSNHSPVDYAFRAREKDGVIELDTIFTRRPESSKNISIDSESFAMILFGDIGNILYQEEQVFESYRIEPDSSILVVGLPVDSTTTAAISKIERAGASYGLLTMFQERVLDRNTIYLISVILLVIITALAIAAASWLSKGTTRPIKELVGGFRKVGEGDLEVELKTSAKDEIEFLIDSFNKMVSELKGSRQKLIHTERLAAWRDVARQISHEIKNPLTPIQLSLHRLRNKINIPAENSAVVEESFETINEEMESLRKIATEFSEFARMPKPFLVSADINDIIRNAAALYEKNDRNIDVTAELDSSIPETLLDMEQMKRVFINLIKNSIEATAENGGPVKLKTDLEQGKSGLLSENPLISVSITDSGCGMDDEVLKKVFDPYFTTKKDGTGLGMPIIKRIVEEHNGDIFIKSESGNGTVIHITLPVSKSQSGEKTVNE